MRINPDHKGYRTQTTNRMDMPIQMELNQHIIKS